MTDEQAIKFTADRLKKVKQCFRRDFKGHEYPRAGSSNIPPSFDHIDANDNN